MFNIDTARDGDVERGIAPIVFAAAHATGPSTRACTNVVIKNDVIVEEKFETFSLSLSNRDLQGVHLTSSNISVTIEDDDSEFWGNRTVVG